MKLALSACLFGENCKYNGGSNYHRELMAAIKDDEIILVCPEVEGGLPIPRPSVELVDGVAINTAGENVHDIFLRGAQLCLERVKAEKVAAVILQPRSPSCGKGRVYDGSFSGALTEGDGLFVQMLMKEGIPVFTPDEFLLSRSTVLCDII